VQVCWRKKISTEMFFALFGVLICQRLGAVGRWPNPKKGDSPGEKKQHSADEWLTGCGALKTSAGK